LASLHQPTAWTVETDYRRLGPMESLPMAAIERIIPELRAVLDPYGITKVGKTDSRAFVLCVPAGTLTKVRAIELANLLMTDWAAREVDVCEGNLGDNKVLWSTRWPEQARRFGLPDPTVSDG
jgi:hypothetical protein